MYRTTKKKVVKKAKISSALAALALVGGLGVAFATTQASTASSNATAAPLKASKLATLSSVASDDGSTTNHASVSHHGDSTSDTGDA